LNIIICSDYLGFVIYKERKSHIFETRTLGNSSWLIANEYKGRGIIFYSIASTAIFRSPYGIWMSELYLFSGAKKALRKQRFLVCFISLIRLEVGIFTGFLSNQKRQPSNK